MQKPAWTDGALPHLDSVEPH
eukprot:COSAG02_NODE_28829_length_581_cov_1.437759_1_plen_20_part_01